MFQQSNVKDFGWGPCGEEESSQSASVPGGILLEHGHPAAPATDRHFVAFWVYFPWRDAVQSSSSVPALRTARLRRRQSDPQRRFRRRSRRSFDRTLQMQVSVIFLSRFSWNLKKFSWNLNRFSTALEKLYNLLFGFVAIRPSVWSQIPEKLEILAPSLTVFDTHYFNKY